MSLDSLVKELTTLVFKEFPCEDGNDNNVYYTENYIRPDLFWRNVSHNVSHDEKKEILNSKFPVDRSLLYFQRSFENYLVEYSKFCLECSGKKIFSYQWTEHDRWMKDQRKEIFVQVSGFFVDFFVEHPEKLEVFFETEKCANRDPTFLQRFKKKFRPFFELCESKTSPSDPKIATNKVTNKALQATLSDNERKQLRLPFEE